MDNLNFVRPDFFMSNDSATEGIPTRVSAQREMATRAFVDYAAGVVRSYQVLFRGVERNQILPDAAQARREALEADAQLFRKVSTVFSEVWEWRGMLDDLIARKFVERSGQKQNGKR